MRVALSAAAVLAALAAADAAVAQPAAAVALAAAALQRHFFRSILRWLCWLLLPRHCANDLLQVDL